MSEERKDYSMLLTGIIQNAHKVRYSSKLCHFLLLSAMCFCVFSVLLAIPAMIL